MSTNIQVKIKNVYGCERIYPVNQKAVWLTSLTRKKTLDRDEIELIKKLGYQVEVVADQI
jgi:G:T-mismatch repair DNA endonuclease (very short patch repair protein)